MQEATTYSFRCVLIYPCLYSWHFLSSHVRNLVSDIITLERSWVFSVKLNVTLRISAIISTAGTEITGMATLFWCAGRIPTVAAPKERINFKRYHNYLLKFIFSFFFLGGEGEGEGWWLSVTIQLWHKYRKIRTVPSLTTIFVYVWINIIFNSVRLHNHFITQGNYKATCFDYRLVILMPILSIVSQDAMHLVTQLTK